MGLLGTRMFFF